MLKTSYSEETEKNRHNNPVCEPLYWRGHLPVSQIHIDQYLHVGHPHNPTNSMWGWDRSACIALIAGLGHRGFGRRSLSLEPVHKKWVIA